jgi:hypothetical protein
MTDIESVLFTCPAVMTAQRNQYLAGNQFKMNMSHIVKDLAIPAGGASPRWVYYIISRDVW